MREILIGYLLLWAVLITMTLLTSPAAANEPIVAPEATCQGWYDSWRTDKAELRTAMKQAIKNTTDEMDYSDKEQFQLCLLMNVDYMINTILSGCDAKVPLRLAFTVTLQETGVRCAT